MPPEGRYACGGLRRGGYLVTVTRLTADLYDRAGDILDSEGAIDFDELHQPNTSIPSECEKMGCCDRGANASR
jgi:hypothetical protein